MMKWKNALCRSFPAHTVHRMFAVKLGSNLKMIASNARSIGLKVRYRKMSDKNFNEWLFADIDDLIDCNYSDESEVETNEKQIW